MLSGLGLILIVPAIVWLEPWLPFALFLGLVGVGCLVYIYITWIRQQTVVIMDEQTLTVKAANTIILNWDEVTAIRLAFFSLREDKTDGWMRLTIEAGEKTVKIDSQIHDFIGLVRRASRTISENSFGVDGITRANLHALGIYSY